MSKKVRHKNYKFVNNETDNVIYFLSVPEGKSDLREALEATKHKLAIENGIYIGSIYYVEVTEHDLHAGAKKGVSSD